MIKSNFHQTGFSHRLHFLLTAEFVAKGLELAYQLKSQTGSFRLYLAPGCDNLIWGRLSELPRSVWAKIVLVFWSGVGSKICWTPEAGLCDIYIYPKFTLSLHDGLILWYCYFTFPAQLVPDMVSCSGPFTICLFVSDLARPAGMALTKYGPKLP